MLVFFGMSHGKEDRYNLLIEQKKIENACCVIDNIYLHGDMEIANGYDLAYTTPEINKNLEEMDGVPAIYDCMVLLQNGNYCFGRLYFFGMHIDNCGHGLIIDPRNKEDVAFAEDEMEKAFEAINEVQDIVRKTFFDMWCDAHDKALMQE